MLIRRNLSYYARRNVGVVLGAALCTMVLAGALHVGDSVRSSLRELAGNRTGQAEAFLNTQDSFFREALADELGKELDAVVAPAFMVRGTVSNPDADEDAGQVSRVPDIQVLGVDQRFFHLAPEAADVPLEDGKIYINPSLARRLGVQEGAILNLRLEEPSQFSRDAPLSGTGDKVARISRQEVAAILEPRQFGNFSLHASQIPPNTLVLPITTLRNGLENAQGKANLMLVGKSDAEAANAALEKLWEPVDAGLETLETEGGYQWALRSASLFIPETLEEGLRQLSPSENSGVLTYLVNAFEANGKMAPYSFATAFGTGASPGLPDGLPDDKILVNQWLADDLGLQAGSEVTVKYFVTTGRRQLKEESATFTVQGILPMPSKLGKEGKSPWTPDFPGLSDQENCRDWEPGFSIDETKIRDQDELYWDEYRGTPKAFITLAAGQELWGNRWGKTTGIRIPKAAFPDIASLETAIRAQLPAKQTGLQFRPFRQQALDATDGPIDFAGLFAGFSFFIILAALALTGMLFVFNIEQRNQESGLLLALGHTPQSIRRRLLAEGTILAAAGTIPGAILGLLYAKAMLWGLANVWTDATGAMDFTFTLLPATVATGLLSGLAMAVFALWVAIRSQLKHEPRELLHAGDQLEMSTKPKPNQGTASQYAASALFFLSMVLFALRGGSSEMFFAVGFLLLVAALFFFHYRLSRIPLHRGDEPNLTLLGYRNTSRRKGRSLVTIGILASGTFMVVAVSSFHLDASKHNASDKSSGTGGFTLAASSAIPVYDDLNSSKGRDGFGIDPGKLEGTRIVPMRVRQGEDASCLNLNQATRPTLLGVTPHELSGRFSVGPKEGNPADPWTLLEPDPDDHFVIPGIADQNTAMYSLHKGLGDIIEYTDDNGRTFGVRLVAMLKGSLLQGQVLVSEENFMSKFPDQAGYRQFLIETPAGREGQVSAYLAKALADQGFDAVPSTQRLQEFFSVENTYLAIFQALGGLGLLLGTAGLAIVVARNLLERRREFGILEAIGFSLADLRKLSISEHRWLLLWGLMSGTGAAIIAVWPAIRSRQEGFPLEAMACLVVALLLLSLFWIYLATRLSLKESALPALREE